MQTHNNMDEGHMRDRCPHCNSTDIFNDKDSGERVCKGCGVVLSETIMDPGREWRAYSNEDIDERQRAEVDKDIMNRSSSTTFNVNETKDLEQKAQFYRFNREMWRAYGGDSKARNLNKAKSSMNRITEQIGLGNNNNLKEFAARIYVDAYEKGLVRGRTIEGVVSASIYAACRKMKIVTSIRDIAKVSDVDKGDVARIYRLLHKELDMSPPVPDARNRVARISGYVKAPYHFTKLTERILEEASKLNLTAGRSPDGLAAGAFYISSKYYSDKHTGVYSQGEISRAADVTEVTIRNRYKDLMKSFKDNKITIEELAEGIEVSKEEIVKPVRVKGRDIASLEMLRKELGFGDSVYSNALDIYKDAIKNASIGSKNKSALMDASLSLAMELYEHHVCPVAEISRETGTPVYKIKDLAERIREELELGEAERGMSRYVEYAKKAISKDYDMNYEIGVLLDMLLEEYERDPERMEACKMGVVAAAMRKVFGRKGQNMDYRLSIRKLGLTMTEISEGEKAIGKYDINRIMEKYRVGI